MNKQKNILLTGATSGLGFGVLCDLVSNEHNVIAVGRNFEKITSYFGIKNPFIQIIQIDLNNVEEIPAIFNHLSKSDIKLDSFINCAGFEETIPLKQYENERIQKIFTVNLFSTIEILKYFSLKKYSNDGSSVVLISSVMGNLGQPGKIGYCASKAAIGGVVKAASLELAKRKIRVNSVSPGIVKTKMVKELFQKIGEVGEKEIVAAHPLGVGDIDDVVPSIIFLAIGNSSWITGIDLVIDGGYSAK